jgi:hypothetical protein
MVYSPCLFDRTSGKGVRWIDLAMTRDVAPLQGYPEPYGLLCAILQDGSNEWRAELGGNLGSEVMVWRARPGGPSMGAIVLHMIGAEVFWFEKFALGRQPSAQDRETLLWGQIDVDQGSWPEALSMDLFAYFELHDRFRARTLEAIRNWPSAESVGEHDGDMITMRWVLGHVIQHEAYHGGQLVMMHDLWKNRG